MRNRGVCLGSVDPLRSIYYFAVPFMDGCVFHVVVGVRGPLVHNPSESLNISQHLDCSLGICRYNSHTQSDCVGDFFGVLTNEAHVHVMTQ